MKLESEIKQSKLFKNEVNKAIVNAIYTGNKFQEITNSVMKDFDLNDQHFNILRILKEKHPESICPGEIKEVLMNKRGDLTRLIDKMVQKGLVSRSYNAENRRMVDISITKAGISALGEMSKKMKALEDFEQNLTEEEAKILNELLDKLRG